jgi:phage repressor protein C with HTH and peptisase S24 domain
MASRRNRGAELAELAATIYRLLRQFEIANPSKRLKIHSSLGRILQHCEEYRRLRGRGVSGTGRRAADPSYFTVSDAAEMLNVPLCAFAPTLEHQPITDPQRDVMTMHARWILANFGPRAEERAMYASDFDDPEPYVTVRKHAETLAAGRAGTDTQLESETVDVLKSIPRIGEARLQVITVRGNSMFERLRDGDRVLIDTAARKPLSGEIVAVDREHLGRTIGYWRREGKNCFLDKHNEQENTIVLGPNDEWMILGTITRIVDSPLHRRDRPPRRTSK